MLRRILPAREPVPLHGVASSRRREAAALTASPPHALMQRAGRAVARLALAMAPHARSVWIAAGPGNNGGDGLEAALHLHAARRAVTVWLCADPARLPPDAAASLQRARDAGVDVHTSPCPPPAAGTPPPGLAIDALLGLGQTRDRPAPAGDLGAWLAWLAAPPCPVLAVDLPTGLDADTGQAGSAPVVRADHTLALLNLKPGLFTGIGRDQAGTVWLDDLDLPVDGEDGTPDAWLAGPPPAGGGRAHASHKGRYGDVLVVGGAPGMGGAALLAARAAHAAGAGRTWWVPLDPAAPRLDPLRPELMARGLDDVSDAMLQAATIAAGCGGGQAIAPALPRLLAQAARLVLDADALNAVAADPALARALRERAARGQPTVLTPHPLEAGRLLGVGAAGVQADRLAAARQLASALHATVVLKGSGTVVASPGAPPAINPTGGPALATAGTGDVLAGWLAGRWSERAGGDPASGDGGQAHAVALAAVWEHGAAADGHAAALLRAGDLVERLAQRAPDRR